MAILRLGNLSEASRRRIEIVNDEMSKRWLTPALEQYEDALFPIEKRTRPSYMYGDLKAFAESCRVPLDAMFQAVCSDLKYLERDPDKRILLLDEAVAMVELEIITLLQRSTVFNFSGIENEIEFRKPVADILDGFRSGQLMYFNRIREAEARAKAEADDGGADPAESAVASSGDEQAGSRSGPEPISAEDKSQPAQSERDVASSDGDTPAISAEQATLAESRKALLEEYKKAVLRDHKDQIAKQWSRKIEKITDISDNMICEAKNSLIYRPRFLSWKRGELPDDSATTKNFERFLSEGKPPIPKPK